MRATTYRRRIAAIIVVFVATQVFVVACATYGPATKGSAAVANGISECKAAVRSLLQSQVDAWNRGDLNGFLHAYSDSPDLMFFSNGRTFRGRTEIESV